MLGTSDGAAATVGVAAQVRRVRTSQPQHAAGIDSSNWFGARATQVIMPSREQVNSATPTNIGCTSGVMSTGLCYTSDGTVGNRITALGPKHTNNFWALLSVRPSSVATFNNWISQGGFGTSLGFTFGTGTTTNGKLGGTIGNVAGFEISGSTIASGSTYNVLFTMSGSTVTAYMNGALCGSASPGSISGQGAGPTALLAASSGVDNWAGNGAGSISLAALGSGVPNASLAKSITDNPWQIFAPDNHKVWVPA